MLGGGWYSNDSHREVTTGSSAMDYRSVTDLRARYRYREGAPVVPFLFVSILFDLT